MARKNHVSNAHYIKHVTIVFVYLFVVWGFYRQLFKLPDELEELVIKPLVWLIPIVFFLQQEGLGISSLGITTKKLFPSLYLSLALGILFAVEGFVINFVKHSGVDFSSDIGQNTLLFALFVSFATAVSEELAFRGYIFNRLLLVSKNEWIANTVSSVAWGIIHIPVAIFVWKLNVPGAFGYILLTTIFGIGSAFVFARTKNVFSSILLHVFWEWPIILFR